jgi:hypothetical protein
MMRCVAALAAAALTGCAVDCASRDWRSRGYADGFGGHPAQDLRIARQCPDFSQATYLEGWRAGYDEWYRMIGSMDID